MYGAVTASLWRSRRNSKLIIEARRPFLVQTTIYPPICQMTTRAGRRGGQVHAYQRLTRDDYNRFKPKSARGAGVAAAFAVVRCNRSDDFLIWQRVQRAVGRL